MYCSRICLFLIFLSCYQSCLDGAKILGVFHVAGKSVNILYNKLMKGLADAGHDVTVISSYKNQLPIVGKGSYTDVVLTGFAEDYEKLLENFGVLEVQEGSSLFENQLLHETFLPVVNKSLHHPNVRKLLKEKHRFDLVITEYLWSESTFIFSTIYKCPLVIFVSMGGVNPYVTDMLGNPLPMSYIPHMWMLGEYKDGMGFFDRLYNVAFYLSDAYHRSFSSFPDHNKILRSVFSNPPNVEDLYYNASFVLLGSHFSLRQTFPLAPNMIEIGGFHIDPPKKLPQDLQQFLDDAKGGAIFFSMGSHVKSSDFSQEKISTILNVFKRLKMKILWKYEQEVLPGQPENVLVRKWLPQMDILAHPNVKLFITHGGYGSTLETIYHGVPALMIPVFGDQFNNANLASRQGYALKLSYRDVNFNEETFYKLIREMLDDPKYRKRAKEIADLFHDRPMKPLDTAVYWTEYVIRHKGADHLKLGSLKLKWYQFYMVDIIVFLSVVVLLFVGVVKCVCSRVFLAKRIEKPKVE